MDFYPSYETSKFLANSDIIIIATPLLSFKETLQSLPIELLRGKLIFEAGALNAHPKKIMVETFGDYPDIDLIVSNPMFGNNGHGDDKDPYSAVTLEGRPLIYEKVRISNVQRCESFLDLFKSMRCQMVEMNSEQHDASVGDAEFVTHLTGRLLVEKQLLPPTPVISKEYAALCDVAEMTAGDSFDLFFGMFKYNDRARDYIFQMRENLANIERQLVAKESYLEASAELQTQDRKRLLAETKSLLQEIVSSGGLVTETPPRMADDDSVENNR